MQVVKICSTPRNDAEIKTWLDLFYAGGWYLLTTETSDVKPKKHGLYSCVARR
ncbi:MAG: hypothetical protein AB9917_01995 [Negativicutes bacterium]